MGNTIQLWNKEVLQTVKTDNRLLTKLANCKTFDKSMYRTLISNFEKLKTYTVFFYDVDEDEPVEPVTVRATDDTQMWEYVNETFVPDSIAMVQEVIITYREVEKN